MSWKETNVLELWKNSTIVPLQPENSEAKSLEAARPQVHGSRSILWNSLMEMPADDRKNYLSNLVLGWPYPWERRATTMPLHGSILAAAMSNLYCTAKINGDLFFNNPKTKLLESIRSCPKTPIFLGVYVTGFSSLLLNQYLVFKPVLEREERPCSSCVLAKAVGVSLLTGTVFPLVATPYVCYHSYLLKNPKAPGVAHSVDLITLSYELTRSLWRRIPALIGFQMAVGSAVAYSLLWGRHRIFETADIDPELAKECVERRMSLKEDAWYNRLKQNINGV